MSEPRFPPSVSLLLWDVDPAGIDLDRDRWFIMERVMSRGSWDAMRWLRARYPREVLAEFVRGEGQRKLSPRDLAYWALVCGVELPSRPGGGRPSWAGPCILSYRYPSLAPPCAVPIAAMEDLACMKASAIAGRGAAKDFWDLHELLEMGIAQGSLASVLELYQRKYPVEDLGHAVRSLVYFGDADAAPLPRGLTPEHWEEIKSAMKRRVLEL